nr:heme NO-binding domain-containing protein [uncultured Arsenicibacter sp.]
MKGIVFTEFLEMVEAKYGYASVDRIIQRSNVPNDGAYTAIGTYSSHEMHQLLQSLCAEKNSTADEVLTEFGKHLFRVFLKNYPQLITASENSFHLLESVEGNIHVDVLKLYPDAELPRFHTTRIDETTLEMIYESDRRMSRLALGLILATAEHFQEQIRVETELLEPTGKSVRFLIRK